LALAAALSTIAAPCAQTTANDPRSVYFAASPTSGPAPLTVKFCASAGIGLDFGDGTSSGMGIAQAGDCPAAGSLMTTHTYTAPGTFQVTGRPCPSSSHAASCAEVARQASSTTITVAPTR